jgi:hypothetical protein
MSALRASLVEGFIPDALLERAAPEPGPPNQTSPEIHQPAPVTGWSTQFSEPLAAENLTRPFRVFPV